MRLLIVNGSPIFYPDSDKEVVYISKRYNAIYMPDISGYVPKDIINYLFGMQDDGIYSYYFDYLVLKLNLKYNLDTGELTSKFYMNDGYYKVGSNAFGGLDMRDITPLSLIESPKKLLNQPLHKELIDSNDTIPILASNIDTLFKLFKDFLTKYQDDKIKTDTAISTIVTTIKTIPSVVGSPLNPSIVANPINTTDNIVNNINSKVDEFSEYSNDLEKFINDIKEIIKEK
jgi:hypothetical protein